MKKIINIIIVIISSIVIANFINKGCIYLVDKFNLISDSSRLGVLFIPFIIYGVILFVIDPYIIKLINKKWKVNINQNNNYWFIWRNI